MTTPSEGRVFDENVGETAAPTITMQFTPSASPCYFRAIVPKAELDTVMDQNWAERLPNIPEHVLKRAAKGFREPSRERVEKLYGGTVGFHRGAILQYIMREKPTYEGREILMWNDVRLNAETVEDGDVYVVEAMLYLEPRVAWKEATLPAQFKAKLPSMTDEDFDKAVEERLKQMQEKHTIFIPVEDLDALVQDGQFVVASCNATVDGKYYEQGSFRNHKMRIDDTLKAEFRDAVKRVSIGGVAVFSYEEDGKTVNAALTVHNVYNADVPAVDDDLAISCNHKSLVEMKTTYRREIEDYFVRQREELAFSTATIDLMQLAKVDPVPDSWIMAKAREVAGDKASDEALRSAAREVAAVLVRQLVVRAYGIATGISGDHSLAATADYCQTVRAHILKNLDIEEMETEDGENSGS